MIGGYAEGDEVLEDHDLIGRVAEVMENANSHFPARLWPALAEHAVREVARDPSAEVIEAARQASPVSLTADQVRAMWQAGFRAVLPK